MSKGVLVFFKNDSDIPVPRLTCNEFSDLLGDLGAELRISVATSPLVKLSGSCEGEAGEWKLKPSTCCSVNVATAIVTTFLDNFCCLRELNWLILQNLRTCENASPSSRRKSYSRSCNLL